MMGHAWEGCGKDCGGRHRGLGVALRGGGRGRESLKIGGWSEILMLIALLLLISEVAIVSKYLLCAEYVANPLRIEQ